MTAALLQTKLYRPRPRANLVGRPRLVRKLDDGFRERRQLTLVSAPAGYGKTTLLSDWLETHPAPSAWLSLDAQDDSPSRFWTYVIGALQTLQPELGQEAIEALRAPQPPPLELALLGLLNEVGARSEPAILVLDDYHVITSPAVQESLCFALEHQPSSLHLVVSTRTDPPLPFARLRANNQLVEIRAADLRFTPPETADFMHHRMELELSNENVKRVEERTEGWIAGLQLAALSLQGQDSASAAKLIAHFSGRQQFVLDYLTEQVLSRQPEPIQQFLLETSILDRLTGPLCDAITGRSDGQVMLESLVKANLFLVPLDGERCWYRYHHLFLDLLRARLAQWAQADVHILHTRASTWCEQNRLMNEAVQHALAAGNLDRVAALIKQAAPDMFLQSDLVTILNWLESLPVDKVRADPYLSLVTAWGLLATNRTEAVEPHLKDVERSLGFGAEGPTESLPPLAVRGALGEILVIRSNLAIHARRPERALELTERGLTCLETGEGLFHSGDRLRAISFFNRALAQELLGEVRAAGDGFATILTMPPRDPNLIQLASSHLAQLHIVQGQLAQAAEICRRALDIGGHAKPSTPLAGIAHASLGTVLCEWNQLTSAKNELELGLGLGRQWNNLETLVLAHLGLARIDAARDDWEGAVGWLEQLLEFAGELDVHWADPLVDGYRAYLRARQGNPEPARRLLQASKLDQSANIPYGSEAEAMTLARVMLVLGENEKALELLGQLQTSAEQGTRYGRLIEILVMRALALQSQGSATEARSALARALVMGEPENYARVFLDEGEPMVALIEQAVARGLAPVCGRKLLAQFSQEAGQRLQGGLHASARPLQPLAEPLTERELEVLRLLAQGLSNPEIARALYLSPNTLRVHVYNINSKLGTHSRLQAVVRAREIGLLK